MTYSSFAYVRPENPCVTLHFSRVPVANLSCAAQLDRPTEEGSMHFRLHVIGNS
jgi:hypothetical protein